MSMNKFRVAAAIASLPLFCITGCYGPAVSKPRDVVVAHFQALVDMRCSSDVAGREIPPSLAPSGSMKTDELERAIRDQLTKDSRFLSVICAAQAGRVRVTESSGAATVQDIVDVRIIMECDRNSALSRADVETAMASACRQGAAGFDVERLQIVGNCASLWAATLWIAPKR